MNRTVLLLTLAAFTSMAKAQESPPISTDRPSFSDTPNIVPLGRWQFEAGTTFSKSGGSELTTFGEVLIRIPVTTRAEVRFSNLTYGRANVAGGGGSGLLDPTLGVKFRFADGVVGRSPDMALVAQTTLPWGDRDFRTDALQPTLKFAGFFQADNDDGFGWNVVWSRPGSGSATFDQWSFGAYWSRTLDPKTGTFWEVYRQSPVSRGGPDATFADAGITYLLDPMTQVDFRIGSGFDQRRDGWFLGFGIAHRF